jgi:hypothetical protein
MHGHHMWGGGPPSVLETCNNTAKKGIFIPPIIRGPSAPSPLQCFSILGNTEFFVVVVTEATCIHGPHMWGGRPPSFLKTSCETL